MSFTSVTSQSQVADYGRPTRLHLPCHGPELVWVTKIICCCRTTDMEQSAPSWQQLLYSL